MFYDAVTLLSADLGGVTHHRNHHRERIRSLTAVDYAIEPAWSRLDG